MKAVVIRYPTKKAPLFGKKTHLQEKNGIINNSYMTVHLVLMSAVQSEEVALKGARYSNHSAISKDNMVVDSWGKL